MQAGNDRKQIRRRIRYRIRAKLSGNSQRPRLAVFRSLKHIYAQAIDDEAGRTVAQASSRESDVRGSVAHGGNVAAAKRVGELLGGRLKEAGVRQVVFDRGGFVYHGRVQALADAVREAGIKL